MAASSSNQADEFDEEVEQETDSGQSGDKKKRLFSKERM